MVGYDHKDTFECIHCLPTSALQQSAVELQTWSMEIVVDCARSIRDTQVSAMSGKIWFCPCAFLHWHWFVSKHSNGDSGSLDLVITRNLGHSSPVTILSLKLSHGLCLILRLFFFTPSTDIFSLFRCASLKNKRLQYDCSVPHRHVYGRMASYIVPCRHVVSWMVYSGCYHWHTCQCMSMNQTCSSAFSMAVCSFFQSPEQNGCIGEDILAYQTSNTRGAFSPRNAAQTKRGGFAPADTVSHLPNKAIEWLLRSRAFYCQATGIAISLPCRRDGSRCSQQLWIFCLTCSACRTSEGVRTRAIMDFIILRTSFECGRWIRLLWCMYRLGHGPCSTHVSTKDTGSLALSRISLPWCM